MKRTGPPSVITLTYTTRACVIVVGCLLSFALALAACGSPVTDENGVTDDTDDAIVTPVATEAEIPHREPTEEEQPDTTPPEPVVEQPTVVEEGEWTVIIGPERQEPPETRAENQVLRLGGSTEEPATLDPALVRDTRSAFLARQVFRGLVRLNAELEPIPDLARQIEISPDGTTYRFELHEGITFHDGSPITAERVKASLERATDPALTGGDGSALPARNYLMDIQGAIERMNGEREDIPGIQVIDERTLQIDLVRGIVNFLESLANPNTFIVDVNSAEIGGTWWQSPNGSGPFMVEEWDVDNVLRFVPHDGYVRPPALREVTIRSGREAVGEIRLYETGSIDVANVSTSVIDRFDYPGSPHESEIRTEPLLSSTFAMINPNVDPFTDIALRQALMHAFPRTQVPLVMLDGRVQTANGILPPQMLDGEEVAFPYEYDEELARSLFAQFAERDEETPVTIYTSGGGIPVAMKSYYDRLVPGQVEVVHLRWSEYLGDLERRELPFFVLSWVADGPDPVTFLRALFHSDSPENYIDFSDSEVDDLLDRAAVERDETARTELIRDAQDRILESAVVMPLFHSVDYVLVADHVRGLETTPMGILALETVWIEG